MHICQHVLLLGLIRLDGALQTRLSSQGAMVSLQLSQHWVHWLFLNLWYEERHEIRGGGTTWKCIKLAFMLMEVWRWIEIALDSSNKNTSLGLTDVYLKRWHSIVALKLITIIKRRWWRVCHHKSQWPASMPIPNATTVTVARWPNSTVERSARGLTVSRLMDGLFGSFARKQWKRKFRPLHGCKIRPDNTHCLN